MSPVGSSVRISTFEQIVHEFWVCPVYAWSPPPANPLQCEGLTIIIIIVIIFIIIIHSIPKRNVRQKESTSRALVNLHGHLNVSRCCSFHTHAGSTRKWQGVALFMGRLGLASAGDHTIRLNKNPDVWWFKGSWTYYVVKLVCRAPAWFLGLAEFEPSDA